jgi:hypothetical protein
MAVERAGDTEFGLDAHDSSLHVIEPTGCCPTTALKPRRTNRLTVFGASVKARVALLSGLIWAAWHYPITAVVYRDAGLPPWFWLLTFTFVAVAISLAQAWLRLGLHQVDRR